MSNVTSHTTALSERRFDCGSLFISGRGMDYSSDVSKPGEPSSHVARADENVPSCSVGMIDEILAQTSLVALVVMMPSGFNQNISKSVVILVTKYLYTSQTMAYRSRGITSEQSAIRHSSWRIATATNPLYPFR